MTTTRQPKSRRDGFTAAVLVALVLMAGCDVPPMEVVTSESVLPEASVAAASADPSAAPVAIPYTDPPSILNRDEIVVALRDGYPALLREAGVGGTIRVYFYIDAEGIVRNAVVDQSSGHAPLDDAALRVAEVFRFSPALNQGAPTAVWVSFPITFQPRLAPPA